MSKIKWLGRRGEHVWSSLLNKDCRTVYSVLNIWTAVLRESLSLSDPNVDRLVEGILSGVDYEIRGMENFVGLQAPFVLAGNHYHEAAVLEDSIVVLAIAYYEMKKLSGCYPQLYTAVVINNFAIREKFGIISPVKGRPSATTQMAESLTEGNIVMIAPTGTGEYEFDPSRVKPGAIIASLRASRSLEKTVPIVPIGFFRDGNKLIAHASPPIFPDWDFVAERVDDKLSDLMKQLGKGIACNLPEYMIEC